MRNATVVAPGQGKKLWIVGDHLTFKIGPEHTDGRYLVAEVWGADGAGPPPHVHHREDELFYVLDGEHEFLLRDEIFRGGAGTAVYLPKDIIHTFRIVGGKPSRKLMIATPCGFERFVVQAGEPFEQIPHPTKVGPAQIEKLLMIAPQFGLELYPEHKPTGPAPAPPQPRQLWVLGQLVTIKLTSEQTLGKFSLAEIDVRPGDGVPLHAHRTLDSMFYILDGELEFRFDGRTDRVARESLVHVPAGAAFGFRTESGARMLDIHTPGGFERFFEEAGAPCLDPRDPAPPFDPRRVVPLFAKHGMDLVR